MKPFALQPDMLTMGGVFYPTGHVFALFPKEDGVRFAAEALISCEHYGEVYHARPDVILKDIVRTLGTADDPLPSVGAEGDIVRRIADLASHGHHGLLIHIDSKDDPELVIQAIVPQNVAAAFYYRRLVIEELVAPDAPDVQTQSVTVGTHAATV